MSALDPPSTDEPLRSVARNTGPKVHGTVTRRLGTAILSGRFAPGEVLSGEIASADALAISRGAFREAVQALSAKGLVESRQKLGTRVLPRSRWNLLDPDVLAWAFDADPKASFVQALFELRAIIEPAAASYAARRRSEADLRAMKDALEAMATHTLATDAGMAADRDFHDALLRAAGNEAIGALSATIGAAVIWTTQFKLRAGPLRRDPMPEHIDVYKAIAAADPDAAAAAMRVLVDFAIADAEIAMTAARSSSGAEPV